MPVVDDYDPLFDAWGKALNVDPQLGKTVFWLESSHNPNIGNGADGEIGGMQMKPETAGLMAKKLGFNPRDVNLRDMGWAVPLAMQYLADGINATGSGEGALGYYQSGSADPRKWRQSYIEQGVKSYPNMTLHLPPPPEATASAQPQGAP